MNEIGGYRKDLSVALTGLDIDEKARLVEAAFWRACPFSPEEFDSVTSRLIRTDKSDPSTNEEAVATWRLTLKDHDERKVGRGVADAVVELALSTRAGLFHPWLGAVCRFALWRLSTKRGSEQPRASVRHGARRGNERPSTPSLRLPRPTSWRTKAPASNHPEVRRRSWRWENSSAPDRVTKAATRTSGSLREVMRPSPGSTPILSVDELRRLLPETAPLVIDRYRLPALRILNFVLHDLLDEGVAASTRQDAQAKGLGEWLRSRYVEMPTALLHS